MNTMSSSTAKRPEIFYHGTSVNAALQIQARGFDLSCSGSGAGNLLGKGVYCTTVLDKATDYAKKKPGCGVVLQLRCQLGLCKKLVANDPMMTTWQNHGYDSAWHPNGANQRQLSENCFKDPASITVLGVIAGDTAALLRMGMAVRVSDGRLAMVGDEDVGVSAEKGNLKRKRDGEMDDNEFLGLLRAWKLAEVVDALVLEGITCSCVLVEELTSQDIEKIPIGVVYRNRLLKLTQHLCAEDVKRKSNRAHATNLLKQMQSRPGNAATRHEGLASLMQLLVSNPALSTVVVSSGLIQVLVAVLTDHQDDPDLQELACRMLAHFSVIGVDNNHDTLRLMTAAIPALVLSMMACPAHEGLQVQGVAVLRQCLENDKCPVWMATTIAKAGGIDATLCAMRSQQQPFCWDTPLLQDAVNVLLKLQLTDNYTATMLSSSGIKVLLGVMSRQSHVDSIQNDGWCVLKKLAKEANANKVEMLKEGGCSLLLRLMVRAGTDSMLVRRRMQVLLELAVGNWKETAPDSIAGDAFTSMVAVMRSQRTNSYNMTLCFIVTNELCLTDQHRAAFVVAEGMNVVSTTMQADALGNCAKLAAVGCQLVCTMSVAVNLRPVMIGNGVIQLLVTLMRQHKSIVEVQEHATAALHNFAMHSPLHRALICNVGGIQVVVSNMQREPKQLRLQKISCMLLRFMSCENESHPEIVKAGGIASVVAAMRADVDTLKTTVAGVAFLNNIAVKCPERQELIIDVGGMDLVLLLMKLHATNETLQTYACHFLFCFVRNKMHQEAVVSAGGIPALLQSMSRSAQWPVMQNMAVHMIVVLAQANPTFDTLVKIEGALPVFTDLLAQQGLDVKNRKAVDDFLARHTTSSEACASAQDI